MSLTLEDEDDTAGGPVGVSAVTSLLLSVMAPPRANKPPSHEAPAFTVMEIWARMIPEI
jgi:hypothetical protein